MESGTSSKDELYPYSCRKEWTMGRHSVDPVNKIMDPKFVSLLGQCHSLGMDIRALSCDIDGVNIEIIGELPANILSEEKVKEV